VELCYISYSFDLKKERKVAKLENYMLVNDDSVVVLGVRCYRLQQ